MPKKSRKTLTAMSSTPRFVPPLLRSINQTIKQTIIVDSLAIIISFLSLTSSEITIVVLYVHSPAPSPPTQCDVVPFVSILCPLYSNVCQWHNIVRFHYHCRDASKEKVVPVCSAILVWTIICAKVNNNPLP